MLGSSPKIGCGQTLTCTRTCLSQTGAGCWLTFAPLMMSLGEQFWCLEEQCKRPRAPSLSLHRALARRGEQVWCLEEQFERLRTLSLAPLCNSGVWSSSSDAREHLCLAPVRPWGPGTMGLWPGPNPDQPILGQTQTTPSLLLNKYYIRCKRGLLRQATQHGRIWMVNGRMCALGVPSECFRSRSATPTLSLIHISEPTRPY